MNRQEAYNKIKLANNGYTKVTDKLVSHVSRLIELGKVVEIAPGYVAPVEVADAAQKVFYRGY